MESTQIIKLFGLLEASAGHAAGRALAELAAEVGLTKPTAHRILKTLVALGYMERSEGGVYRQTKQLRRLVSSGDDSQLLSLAEEPLRELHEATRETVNLGVLRQSRVVYLVVLESPQPLRRTVSPSMTDPFPCTALGRAIAANLPPERQHYLLMHTPLEKRTPATLVDPERLAELLAEVREMGYATEENETDIGVACFAAAVFDRHGVAAAISLSVPTVRLNDDKARAFVAAVRHAANRLSDALREVTPA